METHRTSCQCRDEVLRNGVFVIAALVGLMLMMGTNFPELMGDIPAHVEADGVLKTWEWLKGAVCDVKPHGRPICPEEGEESILMKLLAGGWGLFLFVWLATRQPIKRVKRMIAGLRTLRDALKKKLAGKGG